MVFKFTDFYLLSGLPGDRNRLQGVERCYRQVGLTNTPSDGDCVAIPTVSPGVRSKLTYYNLFTITHYSKPHIINIFLNVYLVLLNDMPKARGSMLRTVPVTNCTP